MSFIASCSGGKDSLATLILAKEHGEPLDEVVYAEVMFDENTSRIYFIGGLHTVRRRAKLRLS